MSTEEANVTEGNDKTQTGLLLKWMPAIMGIASLGGGGVYTTVAVEDLKADIKSIEVENRAHTQAGGHSLALSHIARLEKDREKSDQEAEQKNEKIERKLDDIQNDLSAICATNPRAKCTRRGGR